MAFCTKCGNELREGNAFCTKCGARVVVPDAATEEEPLNPEEVVAGSAAEEFGHPSNSDYEELPESRPTPDRGEAEPDPTVEELKKMAGEAKDYINRAANRVKATVEETKASYRAAESGEDAQSDPISDQLSAAILSGARWLNQKGKKPKAPNTDRSTIRPKKNTTLAICAAAALLLAVCLGMMSCLASSGTSSNSTKAGNTSTTKKVEEKTYTTHINVKCNKNWFFSTYDVRVYVDGGFVGTLGQGEEGSWDKTLTKGSHQIKVCNRDDEDINGTKTFEVTAESVLECTVATTSTQVEFKEFSCQTKAEAEKAEAEVEEKQQEDAAAKAEAEKKQQEEAAAEAEAEKKQQEEAAAEAEAKAKREAEAAEQAKVLTVDNCEDLANMLTSSSSDASAFAAAYSGRTIEFDGNIAYMNSHNGAKTRFDVLIYAGDYSETSAKGPHMRYEDVNYFDMGASGIDSVQMGLNVRIRAKVGSYNSSTDILSLTPISMTAR